MSAQGNFNGFEDRLEDVVSWRDAMHRQGKKIVLTNGCFDLLHAGHVRYLAEARALGDALVVAVNGDASVRRIKGEGRPVYPEADRCEVLKGLRSVDRVVVFEEERATRIIQSLRPHIYCKGGDYTVDSLDAEERNALDACDCKVQILSLLPGRSTSATMERMRDIDRDRKPRLRIGVLGSGRGTNFGAILAAINKGELHAEIATVISDTPGSGILRRAREAKVDAIELDTSDKAWQQQMCEHLEAAQCDLIVLAGFMRLVKEPVLSAFEGRIINVHPSLLPKYRGLEAWRQALEAGERETGCTVHYVDAGVDTGEIIDQMKVPVIDGDTPESLHARIQEAEHRLYPKVIGSLAESLLAD